MNSRQKGKRGELELANILKDYGFDCRRGQQYCGSSGDADVIGLPGVYIECKRVENLNLSKAFLQAQEDAMDGEVPAVFHRKNCEDWKVTISLSDFISLYKKAGDMREG